MGWSFRKSINLGGGMRLNLSKGGVGMSAGVKGLRFGVSPNGRRYVQCGRGGIYYRKTWAPGSSSAPPSQPAVQNRPMPRPGSSPTSSVTLAPFKTIDSGDVSQMSSSTAADLLAEIRSKHRLPRLHRWIGAGLCIAALTTLGSGIPLLIASAVIATPAAIAGLCAVDRRRKLVDVHYDLDPDYIGRYQRLLSAFKGVEAAQRVWTIEAQAEVLARKYHAGASHVQNRTPVSVGLSLPPYFTSNIRPPMIPAGRQTLYLFPDTVLVFDGGGVGSVSYEQLQAEGGLTRFIESDAVPRDARQVDSTWRYVNKNGGPDRRFRDNRQLPVMEYGLMRLRSSSGLNEEFHVSRGEAVAAFINALRDLGRGIPLSRNRQHA